MSLISDAFCRRKKESYIVLLFIHEKAEESLSHAMVSKYELGNIISGLTYYCQQY